MRIDWTKQDAGFVAQIGTISLYAMPEHTIQFGTKAKRGTKWRYGASHWNSATSTLSPRYGRDTYRDLADNAKDAMRMAESVYNDAVAGVVA